MVSSVATLGQINSNSNFNLSQTYPNLTLEAIKDLWTNVDIEDGRHKLATSVETFMSSYLGITGLAFDVNQPALNNLLHGTTQPINKVFDNNTKAAIILAACSTTRSSGRYEGEISVGDWLRQPRNFLRLLEALADPSARKPLLPENEKPSNGGSNGIETGQRLVQRPIVDEFLTGKIDFASLLKEIDNITNPDKHRSLQRYALTKIYQRNGLAVDKSEFSKSFIARDTVMPSLASKNCNLDEVITLLPSKNQEVDPKSVLRSILANAIYMSPVHSLIDSEFDNSISPNFFYGNWLKLKEQLVAEDTRPEGISVAEGVTKEIEEEPQSEISGTTLPNNDSDSSLTNSSESNDVIDKLHSAQSTHHGREALIQAKHLPLIKAAYEQFKTEHSGTNPNLKEFTTIIVGVVYPGETGKTISPPTISKFVQAHSSEFPLTDGRLRKDQSTSIRTLSRSSGGAIHSSRALIRAEHFPLIQSGYGKFKNEHGGTKPNRQEFAQIVTNAVYPDPTGRRISEPTIKNFLDSHQEFELTRHRTDWGQGTLKRASLDQSHSTGIHRDPSAEVTDDILRDIGYIGKHVNITLASLQRAIFQRRGHSDSAEAAQRFANQHRDKICIIEQT